MGCCLLFNFTQFFNFGKGIKFGLGTVRNDRVDGARLMKSDEGMYILPMFLRFDST